MFSRILAIVLGCVSVCATLQAQVPQLLNYQGRVVVGSTNFNGTGQFKFVLINGTNGQTLWSNDNSGSNGSEPTSAASLSVSNGLYSVLLGDTSIQNMVAIPFTVFNNSDVRLRVWFNDGSHGSQQLSPDQRIASVGYALMANSISDGAITSSKIAPNAVTSAQIDPATVQTRISGTAGSGQFIKAINPDGTLVTAVDQNSGGTVTNITAGSGLQGGAITTSGTISLNLANQNTWTGNQIFQDGRLFLRNSGNNASTVLSAPSASGARTITLPNTSGTVITTGNLSDITATGGLNDLIVNTPTTSENDLAVPVAFFRHLPTEGVGANGIGVALEFDTVDTAGANRDAASIKAVLTNAQANSLVAELDFVTQTAGFLATRMSIDSNGVKIGASGDSIVLGKNVTATLNFPSTAAGASSDLTMAVSGAVVSDAVFLGTPAPPAGCSYSAWVSAANTVTVRLLNTTNSAVDPGSATFRVVLMR
jgi:hypothetical protein